MSSPAGMSNDVEFLADEIQMIIKQSVDAVLAVNEPYVGEKVRPWGPSLNPERG